MKKKFLLIGIIAFSLFAHGFLFGAEEEKPLSWEEKYKDRPGVYLLYETTVELKDNWSCIIKKHRKTKIQNQEGQSWGEIPIYYNNAKEKVTHVKAYTTTPDGKKHKYSKIQDLKLYVDYPMYSDEMVKVITMPQVNIGSTIEYETTAIRNIPPIKNSFWYTLNLNLGIPCKDIKVTLIFPKKLDIKYKEFNLNYKPKIKEKGKNIIYEWQIKDMEIKDFEDFMPPPDINNIDNCAEFCSIKSWKDISDWYLALVKKNMITNSRIEDKVRELIKGKKNVKDKSRAILKYLQDDFRYVSMSFGSHALEPHPTDEVFKNKYGDCKDLSLLCMLMLKIAGIESNITFFNNEFDMTDPQYDLPIPVYFDHMLLEVQGPSGNFYIDPLLHGYDIGEYPLSYQMAYTFVVTEDGGRFGRFPVFDEKRYYTKTNRIVNIREDSSALMEIESLFDLDFSIDLRYRWKTSSQKQKDDFLNTMDAMVSKGGKVIERSFENIEGEYGPVKAHYKFEVPNLYPIIDDMIIISSSDYERKSYFTKEKRENPIFFPVDGITEDTTIYRIPKGFYISYVPKDLDFDIGIQSHKRHYKKEADRVTVSEVSRFRRMEIPVERYNEVKAFYDKLAQESKQQIIAKKVVAEPKVIE